MVVSRWPASAVAEVSLVSKSPRVYVLCAKKFALRAQNTPNSAFCAYWAILFAEVPLEGLCCASSLRQPALRPGLVGDARHR